MPEINLKSLTPTQQQTVLAAQESLKKLEALKTLGYGKFDLSQLPVGADIGQIPSLFQKTKDGIVASSQPSMDSQAGAAGAAATQALTPSGDFGLTSQGYLDYLKQRGEQTTARGEQFTKAIQLKYDAQLAQSNFTYNQAIQELEGKRVNAVEAATSRAVALNPYSQARQASTAANFTGKLNQIYQAEENKLKQQSQLAAMAIQANNTAALIEAQANINETLAGLDQKAFDMILSLEKEERAESRFQQQEQRFEEQFEKTYALDVKSAEISKLNIAQDNLHQLIQMSGVPENITSKSSDEWTMADISPYLDFALASGFDFNTAVKILPSMLQGATLAQQRQELAMAKEERLALAQIAAQNKLTNAQLTIQAATNAQTLAASSGAPIDSLEYALAAAEGTQNSLQTLPRQSLDKYKSFDEMVNRLETYKESIDELAEISNPETATRISDIFNYWMKNPLSDDMQLFLARQIPTTYRLLTTVYTRDARVSDADIKYGRLSLGTGAQSPAVREQIFQDHLDSLKQSAITELRYDSLQGFNTFTMKNSVEHLINEIDKIAAQSKPKVEEKPETGETKPQFEFKSTYKGFRLPR